MIDEAVNVMTKLLIQQDVKDKKSSEVEYIRISKVNLLRLCIRLVKMLK